MKILNQYLVSEYLPRIMPQFICIKSKANSMIWFEVYLEMNHSLISQCTHVIVSANERIVVVIARFMQENIASHKRYNQYPQTMISR